MNIFKLVGSIFINTDDANKKLNHTKEKVGEVVEKFGNGIKKAGEFAAGVAAAAGTIAVAVGVKAVGAANDFETAFSKVNTLLSDTTDIEAYKQSIIDLSNKTGVATGDLTESIYSAISAGVDEAKAIGFVEEALKLSEGGFTDAATAVDVMTTALNAYGLSTEEASQVSDYLITTQNLGKTTVDELAGSLGKVIPAASAYNVQMDDLSTTMAIMTKNGIATAQATTYSSQMLNELGKKGSNVSKILKEKTGKTFAQLEAEGSSLGDVIQILSDSVDGDTTAFANLWSSSTAGLGALALLNAGSEEYNKTLEQMRESVGATDAAYETMHGTMEAQLRTIKTNLSNVMIQIGEKLLPLVGQVLSWVQKHLPEIQSFVTKATEAIGEGVELAMPYIKGMLTWVQDTLIPAFQRAWPTISGFVQTAFDAISGFWTDTLRPTFTAIWNVLENQVWPTVQNVFENLIQPAIERVFGFISRIWEDVLKPTFDAISPIVKGIWDAFNEAFGPLKEFLEPIFDWLEEAIGTIIEIIGGAVQVLAGFIEDVMKGMGLIEEESHELDDLNKKVPPSSTDQMPDTSKIDPNNFQFPGQAEGGYTTNPGWSWVGERGPELMYMPRGATVMPLDKAPSMSGQRTEELLMMIAELLKTQKIELDGREMGRMVRTYA